MYFSLRHISAFSYLWTLDSISVHTRDYFKQRSLWKKSQTCENVGLNMPQKDICLWCESLNEEAECRLAPPPLGRLVSEGSNVFCPVRVRDCNTASVLIWCCKQILASRWGSKYSDKDWIHLKMQPTDPINVIIYIPRPRDIRFYDIFNNTGRIRIQVTSTQL